MGRSHKAKKPSTPDSPAASNASSSSPPSISTTSQYGSEVNDTFLYKDQRLSSLDPRVALIKEFQQLLHVLEFSQQQIDTLEGKPIPPSLCEPFNHPALNHLTTHLSSVNDQLASVTAENKLTKETVLDLQTHSLRDDLIFSGIPEPPADDPEKSRKGFMMQILILPAETVNDINFHRVHCLGPNTNRPRPVVKRF